MNSLYLRNISLDGLDVGQGVTLATDTYYNDLGLDEQKYDLRYIEVNNGLVNILRTFCWYPDKHIEDIHKACVLPRFNLDIYFADWHIHKTITAVFQFKTPITNAKVSALQHAYRINGIYTFKPKLHHEVLGLPIVSSP